MQVYISNKEIEQIAEGLVQVSCGEPPPKYIDIDGIAAYLGITVVYEQIAESDPDKIGFASDGVRPLCVWRYGKAAHELLYYCSFTASSFAVSSGSSSL